MPCTKQDKLFKGCWNEEGTSKEEKNPKKKTKGWKSGRQEGWKSGRQVNRQARRKKIRKERN